MRFPTGEDGPGEPSMWYCPECVAWCGYELDSCGKGHGKPRLPLLSRDVEPDESWRVTRRDRLRAKVRRLVELRRN